MSDLISREYLIKSIGYIANIGGIWAKPFEAYKEAFKEFVKGMPSEEKTGRWVETTIRGSTALCCSYCGQESGVLYRYNYCPNCGAKMEVTEDDGDKL